VSTFLVWGSISFIHIRFRRAWTAQGRSVNELPFKSFGYPWNAYFGLASNMFLALVQGWTSLSPFSAGNFVDAYILLPLFPVIYVTYRFFLKTQFWSLHEIDLDWGRRQDLDIASKFARVSFSDDGLTQLKLLLWRRAWRNF
jgi:amino acid transporter